MAYIDTPELDVDDLLLDPDNPRLPEIMERTSGNILEFLAMSSSIDELISAIGSNGYFVSEPLIGVRDANGKIIIVEGNRRLTALKLLSGAQFPDIPKKIIDAIAGAAQRPNRVPVALYDERNDVLNYLGNKHIAGVKPWGALAKARYSKQLFDAAPIELEYQERVRHVASMIGSRSDFIGRALKALDAYRYAEQRGFFGLKEVDEQKVKFSLLSTALDYEGIQDFVYDDASKPHHEREISGENLKSLFSWMFEPADGKRTRLGESRNLNQLSKVVAHDDALNQFVMGASLEQAFKLTDGIEQEFDTLTLKIQNDLREANSVVAEVQYSESRSGIVLAIVRQARQLKSAFEENDEV